VLCLVHHSVATSAHALRTALWGFVLQEGLGLGFNAMRAAQIEVTDASVIELKAKIVRGTPVVGRFVVQRTAASPVPRRDYMYPTIVPSPQPRWSWTWTRMT